MKKTISLVCLVACTFIWGTTFIAQDTGMDNIGPFTFNSVRFFVGFLAVVPFVFLFERKKINQQIINRTNQFFKLSPSLILASPISLKKYPPITHANTDGHIDQCNFSENKK